MKRLLLKKPPRLTLLLPQKKPPRLTLLLPQKKPPRLTLLQKLLRLTLLPPLLLPSNSGSRNEKPAFGPVFFAQDFR